MACLSIHELIGCPSGAFGQHDTILISVSALLFLGYPQSHFPWSAALGPSQFEKLQTACRTLPRFRPRPHPTPFLGSLPTLRSAASTQPSSPRPPCSWVRSTPSDPPPPTPTPLIPILPYPPPPLLGSLPTLFRKIEWWFRGS